MAGFRDFKYDQNNRNRNNKPTLPVNALGLIKIHYVKPQYLVAWSLHDDQRAAMPPKEDLLVDFAGKIAVSLDIRLILIAYGVAGGYAGVVGVGGTRLQ